MDGAIQSPALDETHTNRRSTTDARGASRLVWADDRHKTRSITSARHRAAARQRGGAAAAARQRGDGARDVLDHARADIARVGLDVHRRGL